MPENSKAPVQIEEIYRQQYSHFGILTNILYKLPVVFSTVIGALWYFSFSFLKEDKTVSGMVLILSIVISFAAIFIIQRFRLAYNSYIDNLNTLDGDFKVTIRHSKIPSVICIIQILLVMSLLLSLFSIWMFDVFEWTNQCRK